MSYIQTILRVLVLIGVMALTLARSAGAAECPGLDIGQSITPSPVIGSPSGGYTYNFTPRKHDGQTFTDYVRPWLLWSITTEPPEGLNYPFPVAYDVESMECEEEDPTECDFPWPYLNGSYPSSLAPRFGGRGPLQLEVTLEVECDGISNGYCGIRVIRALSMDFNGDGDCDVCDVNEIAAAVPNGNPLTYDFNGSGHVSGADVSMVIAEKNRINPQTGQPYAWHPFCDTPDETPPSAVTTLAIESWSQNGTVTLAWTSPSCPERAEVYELRYSTSPLTAQNFSSGTLATAPPPSTTPGDEETHTINGLTGCGTYYFALKAGDHNGNWSAISNVASGVKPKIEDVSIDVSKFCANIYWTAPAGASSYDIRYSTSTLTEANFSSGNSASAPSPPASEGNPECVELNGLSNCTWYYVAVKYTTSSGTSCISNVASARTLCGGSPQTCSCGGGESTPASLVGLGELQLTAPSFVRERSAAVSWVLPPWSAGRTYEVAVFDIAGREVHELESGIAEPGAANRSWNLRADSGKDVSNGMYFVALTVGDQRLARRVVIAR